MSSPARWGLTRICVYVGGATIIHAAVAVLLFFGYMQHAMVASHGDMVDSSAATRTLQYLKVVLLYPLYMPLLQHRADLLAGPLGPLFLLLNSFIWVMAAWGLLYLLRLGRRRSD